MAVSVAAIEQEAAARLGPYETHASNASSTQSLFVADDLDSSATPGDKEGMYLLRRGQMANGTTVSVAAGDRQRTVKLYDPDGTAGNGVAGSLLVDRAWLVAPVDGEIAELHSLDPALELRPAVLKGLDRCYFLDRVAVALSGYAAERDLTAALPWLTKPQQVYGVYYLPTGDIYQPRPIPWYEPFEANGHVYLGSSPDPFPFSFYVRALRPVSSVVNNLSAPPSPPIADVATGGSLVNDATYYAAVTAIGTYGFSPASVPVALLTANDGSNTHVARLTVVQVPNTNRYGIYLSQNPAPLFVATITEAQRLAGCTITAQATVTATSPGAGLVDVRVAGIGTAAVQATGPTLDADVLNTDVPYAAAAACAEAWKIAQVRAKLIPLAKSGLGVTQDDANAEFTRQALQHVKQPPDRTQLSYPFGPRGLTGAGAIWD